MKIKYYRVKAVIFDMDGVITNTMPEHYRAWKKILASTGIQVTRHEIYRREGQRGLDSVREILRDHNKAMTKKEVRDLLLRKEELFKHVVKKRFIPGSRSFIKKLYRQNLRLALVTGTSRHELRRILPESLFRAFEVVVTGDEVRNGKPHPEPFQKALRKMGLTPLQAIVIENAPFGIQAAKAAGLACLAVETSLPKRYLKDADGIYATVTELDRSVCFKNMRHTA